MGIENRKSPRRLVQCSAGLLLDGQYHQVTLRELSEGGMLVDSIPQMRPGKNFLITFKVPQNNSFLIINSKALYEREGKWGCQFFNLSLLMRRIIRSDIAAKRQDEFEVHLLFEEKKFIKPIEFRPIKFKAS